MPEEKKTNENGTEEQLKSVGFESVEAAIATLSNRKLKETLQKAANEYKARGFYVELWF